MARKRTHNRSTLVSWRGAQSEYLEGCKIYAHKDKVLGSFEGIY